MKNYTYFAALPVGAHFECNGNECVKRSTRTALLVQYERIFYFTKDVLVTPL